METEYVKPNWRVRAVERWRSARHGVRQGTIQVSSDGITATVFQRDGSVRRTALKWTEVDGVVAYKRDLLIVDLICLGLTTPGGTLELDEEMEGWEALLDVLPMRLPGIRNREDWWSEVVHPAFATNPTILYSSR